MITNLSPSPQGNPETDKAFIRGLYAAAFMIGQAMDEVSDCGSLAMVTVALSVIERLSGSAHVGPKEFN